MTGNRRRHFRIAVAAASAAAAVLLAYIVLFGKLFPYSPVIIGFERTDLENVVVYTQEGFTFEDHSWIDTLFPALEEFHRLEFESRPRIIFFGDSATYAERSPSRARLCEFYNGTIVVAPWTSREDAEGIISLETYLSHELSHSLLHQHMGPVAAMRYPRWLLEGIATLASGQMGTTFYPDPDETRRLIAAGNWMPPETFGTDAEDGVGLDVENRMPFIYCEFALIVEDIIQRFGRDRFQDYMTGFTFWRDHNEVFERAFGLEFSEYLVEFRAGIFG